LLCGGKKKEGVQKKIFQPAFLIIED